MMGPQFSFFGMLVLCVFVAVLVSVIAGMRSGKIWSVLAALIPVTFIVLVGMAVVMYFVRSRSVSFSRWNDAQFIDGEVSMAPESLPRTWNTKEWEAHKEEESLRFQRAHPTPSPATQASAANGAPVASPGQAAVASEPVPAVDDQTRQAISTPTVVLVQPSSSEQPGASAVATAAEKPAEGAVTPSASTDSPTPDGAATQSAPSNGEIRAERDDGEAATAAGKPVDDRPDWINRPKRVEDGIEKQTIVVGPYSTHAECEDELDRQLEKLGIDYGAKYERENAREGQGVAGWTNNVYFPPACLTLGYIRDNVLRETWFETKKMEIGEMYSEHALLHFNAWTKEELKRQVSQRGEKQKAYLRELNLTRIGFGSVSVLAILGTVFGFLKLDTVTKGYYTRRLLAGGVTIILALLAGFALAIRLP